MKLKQYLALSLAIFYMVSVAGVALSLHFCGGNLANVTLFNADKHCKMCNKMAAMEKDNTCCKNAKVEIKVKDDHQASAKTALQKLFEVVTFNLPSYPTRFDAVLISAQSFETNKAPPNYNQPSLHLLNCNFRI